MDLNNELKDIFNAAGVKEEDYEKYDAEALKQNKNLEVFMKFVKAQTSEKKNFKSYYDEDGKEVDIRVSYSTGFDVINVEYARTNIDYIKKDKVGVISSIEVEKLLDFITIYTNIHA